MTKDEALDLALEALEKMAKLTGARWALEQGYAGHLEAITAIKQARALDKKADNARELGLDYEPADGTQVSKVWWDGEKLMAKPIPLVDFYQPVQEPVGRVCFEGDEVVWTGEPPESGTLLYTAAQPAPVQEPVAWMYPDDYERMLTSETFCTVYSVEVGSATKGESSVALYTTPPAAQRQWVGLTDEERMEIYNKPLTIASCIGAVEAKLKEKNT